MDETMINKNRSKEGKQAALEILAYVADHPQAKDGLQGIVEWWILEQRIVVQTAIVKAALWSLVEEGLLVIERNNGSGHMYGINPERIDEIREIVRKTSQHRLLDYAFELPEVSEDGCEHPEPEDDLTGSWLRHG